MRVQVREPQQWEANDSTFKDICYLLTSSSIPPLSAVDVSVNYAAFYATNYEQLWVIIGVVVVSMNVLNYY